MTLPPQILFNLLIDDIVYTFFCSKLGTNVWNIILGWAFCIYSTYYTTHYQTTLEYQQQSSSLQFSCSGQTSRRPFQSQEADLYALYLSNDVRCWVVSTISMQAAAGLWPPPYSHHHLHNTAMHSLTRHNTWGDALWVIGTMEHGQPNKLLSCEICEVCSVWLEKL